MYLTGSVLKLDTTFTHKPFIYFTINMKVLALADTHSKHSELTGYIQNLLDSDPSIKMIIHAGDAADVRDALFNRQEFRRFAKWLQSFQVEYKVFVPGNHDVSIEYFPSLISEFPDIHFLIHQELVVEGIKFFGSPFTPFFHNWAYNIHRNLLEQHWSQVPEDTHVLITHGPAYGIADKTNIGLPKGVIKGFGDLKLLHRIQEIQPKYHIFGHFHDTLTELTIKNYGIHYQEGIKTQFCNVSVVDTCRNIVNLPIILQI